MRAALAVLLALGLVARGAAQETRTVSGVVVDAGTGAPVVDVVTMVQGTALQAITDEQGRFRLDGVPIGSPRLVFRHLAYGEHGRVVVVGDTGALAFLVRISQQA